MSFKFSFERFDWVTRTNVHWKLVPCTWTGHRECTIAKLGAHPTNTKVAVCRRPKILSSLSSSSRTAKIGEVSRCYSTKWFDKLLYTVYTTELVCLTSLATEIITAQRYNRMKILTATWNSQECIHEKLHYFERLMAGTTTVMANTSIFGWMNFKEEQSQKQFFSSMINVTCDGK